MRTITPTLPDLQSQLIAHCHHHDALLAAMPDIDDETLADTLEGCSDLKELLAELLRSALLDEALATGLRARMKEMRDRLQRLETRAEKKRDLALRTMSSANMQKLQDPEFTASIRQGGLQLAIESPEQIPTEYWTPQPAKLNRQQLLTALKSGASISGACLVESGLQLAVRTA